MQTAFRATDVERDRRLMAALNEVADDVLMTQPSVSIGFAGGVPVAMAEHGALSRGVMLSALITFALVSLVLWLHMRSVRLLALPRVDRHERRHRARSR